MPCQIDEGCIEHPSDLVLGTVVEVHPVAVTADREAVQVRVRLPQGGLEDVVQLRHANADRHEKAAPHGRLAVDERDAQLEDALAGRSRPAGTIRRSFGAYGRIIGASAACRTRSSSSHSPLQ